MADQPGDPGSLPERHRGEVLPPQEPVRGLPVGAPTEVTIYESEYSGPLPSEEWFERVEALCPGATKTIVTDYAEQRAHERDMERKSLAFDEDSFGAFAGYQMLRLKIAGGLAAFVAIAGVALIVAGYSVWGLVLLLGEITALTAVFLGQRRARPQPSPTDEET